MLGHASLDQSFTMLHDAQLSVECLARLARADERVSRELRRLGGSGRVDLFPEVSAMGAAQGAAGGIRQSSTPRSTSAARGWAEDETAATGAHVGWREQRGEIHQAPQ
jgi:hypothetical protein